MVHHAAHYFGRFGSRVRLGALGAEPVAFALLSNRSRGHSSPLLHEGDAAATVLAISHYPRRRLAHLNLGADLLNLRCLVSTGRLGRPSAGQPGRLSSL